VVAKPTLEGKMEEKPPSKWTNREVHVDKKEDNIQELQAKRVDYVVLANTQQELS
jgi:hypothetical protein